MSSIVQSLLAHTFAPFMSINSNFFEKNHPYSKVLASSGIIGANRGEIVFSLKIFVRMFTKAMVVEISLSPESL